MTTFSITNNQGKEGLTLYQLWLFCGEEDRERERERSINFLNEITFEGVQSLFFAAETQKVFLDNLLYVPAELLLLLSTDMFYISVRLLVS